MDDVSRPVPSRGVGTRIKDWVEWFGLGRLLSSAGAVLIVCAGAFWLVRTPPVPTEAALPRATTPSTGAQPSGAQPSGAQPTLPPPVGDPGSASAPPAAGAVEITVHVAGAVVAPGVHRLAPGARVYEAIAAAGGLAGDADPDQLNLAAPVADGSRVYVPVVGEPATAPVMPGLDAVDAVDAPSGPIDVNRATAAELETLPGIGPATAAAIIAERERDGPFLSVDDLDRVPGIGPAKLAALRGLVTT